MVTNKEKGDMYEKYIFDYLSTKNNIKECYLWKNVPDYHLIDYGFINSYNEKRLRRKN